MTLPIVRKLPARVEVDPELVELFMAETKQPRRIVTAFLSFDLEPPHRDRTTTLGFSAFENRLLDETRDVDPDPLADDPRFDLEDPKAKR